MVIRTAIAAMALALMAACCGCSGNSSNSNSGNQPVANGSSDSSSSAAAAPAVDVNAKSDSKGVGKYTDVRLRTLNKTMADSGEAVFESKCTVCHKPTEEKLIGPGLKGVTLIRTPEWIMNMITDPSDMTQSDPVAEALLDQYHTQMVVQVSDEEARNILEFLRKNDGAK